MWLKPSTDEERLWLFESAWDRSTDGSTSDTIIHEAGSTSITKVVNLSTSLFLPCCTCQSTTPAAYFSAPDSTTCDSHPSLSLPLHPARPALIDYSSHAANPSHPSARDYIDSAPHPNLSAPTNSSRNCLYLSTRSRGSTCAPTYSDRGWVVL